MNSHVPRRSRSRSPYRDGQKPEGRPSRHHGRNSGRHGHDLPAHLPFGAGQLTKQDLDFYRPMFTLYLDIQKQLDIEELEVDEVKGRWKSFINKWSRGDLAEGWYDPSTLAKARRAQDQPPRVSQNKPSDARRGSHYSNERAETGHPSDAEDEEDDDDYGPAPPQVLARSPRNDIDWSNNKTQAGPTIPSLQDIQLRNEDARASSETAHGQRRKTAEQERLLERKLQKSRLDEIAPRAEAGTRERQLEKKREVADSNRAFAAAKDVGGDVEIRESDLMGGDDLGELKRMKKEQDRRKTEREIKREEILRARMAERGQKLKVMRDKEEKTMSMLREIARDRFGSGNDRPATLSEH